MRGLSFWKRELERMDGTIVITLEMISGWKALFVRTFVRSTTRVHGFTANFIRDYDMGSKPVQRMTGYMSQMCSREHLAR